MLPVLQYNECTDEPLQKLAILLSLANNCERQSFTKDTQVRHRAAAYRQQLFSEMAHQGRPVPKRCAVCQGKCNAHKASATHDKPKNKVEVLTCMHLAHESCLQKLNDMDECPACGEPFGPWFGPGCDAITVKNLGGSCVR